MLDNPSVVSSPRWGTALGLPHLSDLSPLFGMSSIDPNSHFTPAAVDVQLQSIVRYLDRLSD